MKLRPTFFLTVLAWYLPLEELILKALPISDTALLLMHQLPDLLIIVGFVCLAVRHALNHGSLPLIGGKVDFALVSFLCLAGLSIGFNHANPTFALVQLKAFLRYVPLMYVVLMLKPTSADLKAFLTAIFSGAMIQATLGICQLFGGIPARDFLAARSTQDAVAGFRADFTGARFEGVNNLIGSMGNTINYGMFFVVVFVCWLVFRMEDKLTHWLVTLALFIPIYLTGSRSVVIAAILALIVQQVMTHGRKRALAITFALVFVTASLLTLGLQQNSISSGADRGYASRTRFFAMFTSSYVEEAMNQRLGMVVYLIPQFAQRGHVLLGYSPDKNIFLSAVADQFTGIPTILLLVLDAILEDVYWLALLIYFGIMGFALFVIYMWLLYRRVAGYWRRLPRRFETKFCFAALILLIVTIPLNCFNQAFTVRQFSFFLWTTCGFALCSARSYRALLPPTLEVNR